MCTPLGRIVELEPHMRTTFTDEPARVRAAWFGKSIWDSKNELEAMEVKLGERALLTLAFKLQILQLFIPDNQWQLGMQYMFEIPEIG